MKTKSRLPKFSAVFCVNASILYTCLILLLEFVVIATNTWYVKQHAVIKFFHGGLWNECMGTTDITFCSYYRDIPSWLKASQVFMLLSLSLIILHLIYAVIAVARKSLRASVLVGLTNITAFLFLVSLIIYSANGFSENVKPSTTFYVACFTFVAQLISSALSFYAFTLAAKLDRKRQLESGIMG